MTLAPPEWRFTSGNAAALAMFRSGSEAKFVETTPWKLSPEFQPNGTLSDESAHEMIEKAMREGSHYFEWVHRREDGEEFPATVLLSRFELDGRPMLQATVRDITGRKRTEETLRQSHERLMKVLEAETVGVMFWDLSTGCLVDANDTFLELMGYSRADVESHSLSWQKLTPPEYLEVSLAEIRKFQVTGRVGPYEKEYFRKDGTRQWLLFTGSSLGGNQCVEFCVDISGRKKAEEVLREHDEQFRAIFETASIGMAQADVRTGQWLRVNRKMCEITGYSEEELLRMRIAQLTHPDDRQRDWDLFQRTVRGEQPAYQLEKRYIRRDGSIVWVSVNMTVIRDAAGRPLRTIGTLEDITARKQSEEALRLQHSALRAAANGIVITNRNGAIQWVNDAFTTLTGYTAADVFGRNPRVLQSGKHKADFYQNLWSTINAGQVWRGELVNRRKNGSLYDEEMTITPVLSPDGDVSHFIAIKQDITGRKTADLARARLAAVVESSADAIFATDLKGMITDWAPGAERLYGYSAAEAVGQSITLITPMDGQSELRWLLEKLQRGEGISAFEAVRVRKDGEHISVSITYSPLRNADGNIFGVSGISRDISERKRLERQLLEVGEREQRRIGHDLHDGLGQELHGLCYLAKLLERELKEELPARAPEAKRLAKVLGDAFQLTRSIAHGLQPVSAVPEGLMLTLRELAQRTRILFGVDCRFDCRKPVLIHRHKAATHLYRIAQEAVNNAVKHGNPTRIRIRLKATPHGIILGVRDDGLGIRPKENSTSGMGLHIMQYRAEAIRGSLAVQRHPEGGTEVVCTITNPALLASEENNHDENTNC